MPANIEIKARCRDLLKQQATAAALATAPVQYADQVDTFFNVSTGRLKLREFRRDHGELIHYLRDDIAGPKHSSYSISTTTEPAKLRGVLGDALGIRGEVRKRRTIYLVGQTRIHFDDVEQLGSFIELEVVLRDGQSRDEGVAIADTMMRDLKIEAADLIDAAYIDLLTA